MRTWQRLLGSLVAIAVFAAVASPLAVRAGDVELPKPSISDPIEVQAGAASYWRETADDVWVLQGCRITQGAWSAKGATAVIWNERGRYGELTNRLKVYLEGGVEIAYQNAADKARVTDASWYGALESTTPPKFVTPQPSGEPNPKPAIYLSGAARRAAYREGAIRRTQFPLASTQIAQAPAAPGGVFPSPPGSPTPNPIGSAGIVAADVPAPGTRRVRIAARGSSQINAEIFQPNPQNNEWAAVISSGVQIVVDGLDDLGSIDVMTDRMVIWTSGGDGLSLPGSAVQNQNRPLEFYMEGNIVFRQGERVVYADRMYYDVRSEVGVIFKAELLTPVENYQGTLRMRADVIQQLARGQFRASNAYITSSRLGVPGYRLAADDVFLEDREQVRINPLTGQAEVDPFTGETLIDHQRLATSDNNLFLVEEIPIFYWPTLATDLERPTFYLRKLSFKQDSIFGTQVYTTFNPYELLGIENPPEGTDWDLSLDYLSERGIGHGTKFAFQRPDFFGVGGPTAGFIDFWGIQDSGLDNLGADRRNLFPEKDYRHRLLARNRWELGNDWRLTTEVGWISDRNFQEQYFEYEWDRYKDESTGIELKHRFDNSSLAFSADLRINSFFNEVEQLPRGDFFTIGQSLLGDWLTWHQHTHAGLYNMRTPSTPENQVERDKFALLPWEAEVGGSRLTTRQELDLPLELGPLKLVARALGEASHYDEDVFGLSNDRAYGQLGLHASLPMFSADPTVESDLFNLHGLVHKVNFEADVSYSDATDELSEFPLYDPLDDNSIEHFRRRLGFNTFGGAVLLDPSGRPTRIPTRFDERFYALRSGLGDNVTGPAEIADDLFAVRLGIDQRWQTKRGFPGERTLQDFVVLNTGVTFFPDENRDNFGEPLGLADYDFRWHLGERTTILSSGLYDFFADGQRLTRFGVHLNRPPRGSLYLGVSFLDGPFRSDVLQFSYSYRMSQKWVSEFSTGYDFFNMQNIGQRFTLTRIGESFLLSLGFNVDASKGVTGATLNIEPRFLPRTRIRGAGGAMIPPAGAYGLE